MQWSEPAPGLGELPAPGRSLLPRDLVEGEVLGCVPGELGVVPACCPPPGSRAMPTMPFDALQATAPAVSGATATTTSAFAEVPEFAHGVLTASTTALAESVAPGVPGQFSLESLTS